MLRFGGVLLIPTMMIRAQGVQTPRVWASERQAGRRVGRLSTSSQPVFRREAPRLNARAPMRQDPQDELILVLSIVFVMVASGYGAYFYAIWVNGM
jgi:hypothetical protein